MAGADAGAAFTACCGNVTTLDCNIMGSLVKSTANTSSIFCTVCFYGAALNCNRSAADAGTI